MQLNKREQYLQREVNELNEALEEIKDHLVDVLNEKHQLELQLEEVKNYLKNLIEKM